MHDASGDDPRADPHEWVIEHVVGRGPPGGKGLAAAHAIISRGPAGQQMSVQRLTRGFGQVEGRVLGIAERMEFDRCPICLSPGPRSGEHVPPDSLGGTKMTLTCERCNNTLGSRLEVDLLDWWEDAYSVVRMEHDDVRGSRRVARVLLRQTPTGEPVVLADRPDLEFSDAMAPGTNFSMQVRLPDPVRWRLGAIKSAYLGACLIAGGVSETPEAEVVRADLLAARDAPRDAALTQSDHCAGLNVYRTQGPAALGEIALIQIQLDTDEPVELCVSLARTLIVSWPIGGQFVAVDPATRSR